MPRSLALAFTAAAVALAACDRAPSGASSGPTTGGSTGKTTTARSADAAPRAPKPWPTDAPPVTACEVDADCAILISGPAGPDPCCDVTLTAAPMAVAFLTFMNGWRTQHCTGVTCPPMMLPGAQLADCGYQPRCHAGTCSNYCDVPAADRPPDPLPR